MKKVIITIITLFAISFIQVQAANVSQMSSKTTDNLILSEKATVNTSSVEDIRRKKKKGVKRGGKSSSKKPVIKKK